MTDRRNSPAEVVAELQRAFDGAFAEPERVVRDPPERFLGLTIAGSPYALRTRELTSIATVRKIVALPGAFPGFLGLVGHRGALVPAFDLAALLGHEACTSPRWLVLCGREQPTGLAFADLDGQLDASAAAIRPLGSQPGRRHVEAVLTGTPMRHIIAVSSILETIKKQEP